MEDVDPHIVASGKSQIVFEYIERFYALSQSLCLRETVKC